MYLWQVVTWLFPLNLYFSLPVNPNTSTMLGYCQVSCRLTAVVLQSMTPINITDLTLTCDQ